MSPSMIGEAVLDEWFALPGRFSHVDLDAFVLMPNHLHGLVLLRAEGPSLSAVIAAFKNLATRSAREKCRATIGSLWQRGFYDHIVRNERDLERIREYIETNPARWAYDGNNPVNWPRGT